MRPDDRLFRRIATVAEGPVHVLALISSNSAKTRWMEEDVGQALSEKLQGGRIRVIPCLLDEVEMPDFLRGRLLCDFSTGLMRGVAEVLRGIHGDRHLIQAGLDPVNALQLDGTALRREFDRMLALKSDPQRFFFLVDAAEILDEIQQAWRALPIGGDPLDPLFAGAFRKRAAVPLIIPTLSCVLAKVADVTAKYIGRDAGLGAVLDTVIQRTVMFSLYSFWKNVRSSSREGLVEGLSSCDGRAVADTLRKIDANVELRRSPSRSIEAHIFGCTIDSLLDLGFEGAGEVFDSRVNVTMEAVPVITAGRYKGLGPLRPDREILDYQWLRFFVPAIAGGLTVDSSFFGQCIGHSMGRVGLFKNDYTHFGVS